VCTAPAAADEKKSFTLATEWNGLVILQSEATLSAHLHSRGLARSATLFLSRPLCICRVCQDHGCLDLALGYLPIGPEQEALVIR
jgi:hypothetical protein